MSNEDIVIAEDMDSKVSFSLPASESEISMFLDALQRKIHFGKKRQKNKIFCNHFFLLKQATELGMELPVREEIYASAKMIIQYAMK